LIKREAIYGSRLLISLVGLALLAVMAFLYVQYHGVYLTALRPVLGFLLNDVAFSNGSTIFATIAWASRGVNVFVDNPYVEPMAYSPLWLWMTFIPSNSVTDHIIGLGVAIIFLLSLATLPQAKSWFEFWVRFFGTISCGTVLAIERNNIDLLMFLLVLAAIHVLARAPRLRSLSYGIFILAGLLKFYPFAALFVAIRERAANLLLVVLAAAIAIAFLLISDWSELKLVMQNFPSHNATLFEFSALDLPLGAVRLLAHGDKVLFGRLLTGFRAAKILTLILTSFAVGLAYLFCRLFGLERLLCAAPAFERLALATCGAIVLFCFLFGQNFLYRGIFLFPCLPGLFSVARGTPSIALRIFLVGACLAFAFAMWAFPFANILNHFGIPATSANLEPPKTAAGLVLWLAYQAAWWWIATTLFAIALAFAVSALRSLGPWRRTPMGT
jgi:hypothetical protein